MDYYAHSLPDCSDVTKWEPLARHLVNVAKRGARNAAKWNAADWGYLAGLWHDVGKFSPEFIRRLRGERIQVPHAGFGAALAISRDPGLALPLAFAIAGHHAGLANAREQQPGAPMPLAKVIEKFSPQLQSIVKNIDPSIAAALLPPLPEFLASPHPGDQQERPRQFAFFTRMLFSALVDADRLETEKFYARAEGRPIRQAILAPESIGVLRERLDAFIDAKARNLTSRRSTEMGELRAEVLRSCCSRASEPPGIFSLTVPTGGGKTLAGMSFALRHAAEHRLDRVIVVIPFTSIIEQNTRVYRQAFGTGGLLDKRNVLEHHSGVDEGKREEENSEAELRRQTAAENWDAPIIVTTTVQFFESLFSNHPGRCRKLHNVAKSVVILDEVQTLPPENLSAILHGLRELVANYGCTVVLSTATPPALERRDSLREGLDGVKPIVENSQELFDRPAARRVQVEWRVDQVTEYQELAAELHLPENRRSLTIVHRRADARQLCELLPKGELIHLSALMCPAHRLERIDEIRRRLQHEEDCRLISTQLIEAGVDVDFPVVFRALAGIDSLCQSAGRCNRENLLPFGRFVIFRAGTLPPRGTLKKAYDASELLLRMQSSLDIFNLETANAFFRELYSRVSLDRPNVLANLASLNFANVAASFRMIDTDGTRSIAIPWGHGKRRIKAFRRNPGRKTARGLQPYFVQVNRPFFDHITARGVIEVWNDSIGLPTSLFRGWYHGEFGLNPDPMAPLDPEVTVV